MPPPRCPLCEVVVDGDDTLRAHLAASHGLRDDPGTVTHVSDLVGLSPVTPVASAVVRAAVAAHLPPGARVYDPTADDERWRPVVLLVAGVLLILATLVATGSV